MSWEYISSNNHRAAKPHRCDAYRLISSDLKERADASFLSFAEKREIIKAKYNGGMIIPGQEYVKIVGKWEGEFCVSKAILALQLICQRHNLYSED